MFRIRTALAGVVVAAAAVLMIAAPASAHDEEVASSPAANATVTTAPTEVSMTFSGELSTLGDNTGAAITVKDSTGVDWVSGPAVVADDTVTAPLKPGMPNDAYAVTVQVVSSDGHPTSKEFSFTLDAPATAPTSEPSTAPTPSAAPATQAPASQTPAASQASSLQWPLLIGLGVVLLIAIVLVIVMAARRKR